MAHAYTETEIKLYVPALAPIEARLRELGAVCTAPRVLERNLRFDDPAGHLTRTGQVLRLRQDARARVTYKDESRYDGQNSVRTRFEAEVEVSDFDAMRTIFERVGFQVAMIYEKYRTTYHLGAVEVTLDELPYGSFVEIEGDEAAIRVALDALDLTSARVIGLSYTNLFDVLRGQLGLSARHLTFDDFAGVAVPPDWFLTASFR
jgi:adenylate cyclase class 2